MSLKFKPSLICLLHSPVVFSNTRSSPPFSFSPLRQFKGYDNKATVIVSWCLECSATFCVGSLPRLASRRLWFLLWMIRHTREEPCQGVVKRSVSDQKPEASMCYVKHSENGEKTYITIYGLHAHTFTYAKQPLLELGKLKCWHTFYLLVIS